MVFSSFPPRRTFRPFLLLGLLLVLTFPLVSSAKTIDGFGKLKFGMKPSEVAALEGCSSSTECLYEILGKNRYFTLLYGANGIESSPEGSPPPDAVLKQIEIDMGLHTQEWFEELYQVLAAQYPLAHFPTERENALFQNGTEKEITIGFADGSVLMKLIRRPFGNYMIRVVYQDQATAQQMREHWKKITAQ